MTTLGESDCTHCSAHLNAHDVHVPIVLNLCRLTAPVTGLSHMCSNPHATFCSELMLRQDLMHILSHQPLATGNSSPPTQVGIETVCGNTSLSPWWRNLCLSTVFYSVCSDR